MLVTFSSPAKAKAAERARFYSHAATATKALCMCCDCMSAFMYVCIYKCLLARVRRYACVCAAICHVVCMYVWYASYVPRHDGAIIKCGSHAKRVRANLKLANNFIIIIIFMIVVIVIIGLIFAIAVNWVNRIASWVFYLLSMYVLSSKVQ